MCKGYKLLYLFVVAIIICSCSTHHKNINNKSENIHTVKAGKSEIKENHQRSAIVNEAKKWLGVPYAYGKSDKNDGTDCSGMVLKVYLETLDIKLPRNSAAQAEYCKEIKEKEKLPGDLVFFATGKDPNKISHVGIIIDANNFIHASSKRGVVISQLDSPYYLRTVRKFGRILNN